MRRNDVMSDKSRAHAEHQRKYHRKKLMTHTKVCVMVPNDQVEAFKRTLARLKKKWAKP
jgi:hypothetical protein